MSHQSSLTISTGSRWYIDSIPIGYTQLVIWNNRKFWWSDFFDQWKSVYVNQHCSIAIVQRKSCWRKALQQGGFNNYLDRHAVHKTGAEECSNINLSYECLEVINHMELASSATYCHAMYFVYNPFSDNVIFTYNWNIKPALAVVPTKGSCKHVTTLLYTKVVWFSGFPVVKG